MSITNLPSRYRRAAQFLIASELKELIEHIELGTMNMGAIVINNMMNRISDYFTAADIESLLGILQHLKNCYTNPKFPVMILIQMITDIYVDLGES